MGIDLCAGEVLVTEQVLQGGQGGTLADDFGGEGVPKGVGSDLRRHPDLFAELLHHPLHLSCGKMVVILPGKEWRFGFDTEVEALVELQNFEDAPLNEIVQRDDPSLLALGDTGREIDFIARLVGTEEGIDHVIDLQTGHFTHPHAGVAENQKEEIVPLSPSAVEIDTRKKALDFVGF